MPSEMIFHQLFERESSTYTYLLADSVTREAVLIDPVIEMLERDLKLISELGLKLKYVLDTHVHADHVTAAGEIRARTGAQTATSRLSNVPCVDLMLDEGQVLEFGRFSIRAISTPGHTDSCMSFLCDGRLFTGDALLVRGTGRTDFQGGSSAQLFESVRTKLFTLDPETLVYPAHDYRGFTSSTIESEQQHNPRLNLKKTKEEFIEIMANLKLDPPKKIALALPANRACGLIASGEDSH